VSHQGGAHHMKEDGTWGPPTEDVEARKRAHLIIEGPTQESRWKIKVLSGF
jgi:hypothetical protein